jgi:hypothetical protein
MKKIVLFLIITLMFSCKNENNPNLVKEGINTNNANTKIIVSSIGDSLISQFDFVNKINTSIDKKEQRINLSGIKYDYDKFTSWNSDSIEEKKIGKITLKFQKINIKKNDADIFVHVNISTLVNNVKSDTLTVYKQENYAEALVAINEYYFVNSDLNLWTLETNEDEDGIKIISWNQYKINSETGKIVLFKNHINNKIKNLKDIKVAESWSGKYFFEKTNRDELKTSFDISISDLNSITVNYISNGEKVEIYKNLKGVKVEDDKIKIVFNKKYENMGFIYIQKYENEYIISGDPIANINPGNDEYPLKKIK